MKDRHRTVLFAALGALLALAACGPRDASQSTTPDAGAAMATPCEVVGAWRHEHATYGSEIVICAEPDGTHRVRQAFDDGTTYATVLTPAPSATGERYLRDVGFSDYYEILPDGRLVIGDDEGVIATAEPLR